MQRVYRSTQQRMVLMFSAEGIRVVNPFRTRRFFWEDIAGFDLGRWTSSPTQASASARMLPSQLS